MKNFIKKNWSKLIILFIFIVFISSFNFEYANATQGACSDHGGVYCSIGADYDGSVICNDGWKDSSVYYSDADECKQTSCVYPTSSGCKTESDAGVKAVELSRLGGYLGQSSSGLSAANQCRAEIDAYQLELQSYQNCIANSSTSSSSSNYSSTYTSDLDSYITSKMQEYCVSAYGSQSYYYSTNKTCRCNDGYKFGKNNQCVSANSYCGELYGINSFYNSSKNGCGCNSGYLFGKNNQCVSNNSYCNELQGINSSYDQNKKSCICNSGYQFDGASSNCILRQHVQLILHGE